MNQKSPEPQFVPLDFQPLSIEEQTRRAKEFYQTLCQRRTVRDFSDEAVPFKLIEQAIRAAGKAVVEAAVAGWYFYQMPTKKKAWCGYCIAGALCNFGIAALVLPEAKKAIESLAAKR